MRSILLLFGLSSIINCYGQSIASFSHPAFPYPPQFPQYGWVIPNETITNTLDSLGVRKIIVKVYNRHGEQSEQDAVYSVKNGLVVKSSVNSICTEYEYDDSGNITQMVEFDSNCVHIRDLVQYKYDSLGYPISVVCLNIPQSGEKSQSFKNYTDENGNLDSVIVLSKKFFCDGDANKTSEKLTYSYQNHDDSLIVTPTYWSCKYGSVYSRMVELKSVDSISVFVFGRSLEVAPRETYIFKDSLPVQYIFGSRVDVYTHSYGEFMLPEETYGEGVCGGGSNCTMKYEYILESD